jgi:hypothetical protein
MKPRSARGHARSGKSGVGCSSLLLCLFVCCMVGMGLLLQLALAPGEKASSGGPSTNSIINSVDAVALAVAGEALTLSQKIAKWVPRFVEEPQGHNADGLVPPPYEKEFWSPIDVVDVSHKPIVVLCKLNFKKYSEDPHLSPMFKDLVVRTHTHIHTYSCYGAVLCAMCFSFSSTNFLCPMSYVLCPMSFSLLRIPYTVYRIPYTV